MFVYRQKELTGYERMGMWKHFNAVKFILGAQPIEEPVNGFQIKLEFYVDWPWEVELVNALRCALYKRGIPVSRIYTGSMY